MNNYEKGPSEAAEELGTSQESPESFPDSDNKLDCSCNTERERQAEKDDKMASYLRILAGVNKRSGLW